MPSLRQILAFIAPTAALLLLYLLAGHPLVSAFLVGPSSAPPFYGPGAVPAEQLPRLAEGRIQLPQPQLTPDEVVAAQLAGLADPAADGVGIMQCYFLASPANRSITGPLDRFGQMVRLPPFACLAKPRATLLGRPRIDGQWAKVLVTVLDHHRRVQAFTFVLQRQPRPPFKGCWMTEGVYPVGAIVPPAESDGAEPARPPAA